MTKIFALARNLIETHISHGNDKNPDDLIEQIHSIDTGYTRQVYMPHLDSIAYFHRKLAIDDKGEHFPSIEAHIPLEGIFIEEGSINIGKQALPESKWEKYLQIIQGEGPVSDIIDMGSAHATPILQREVSYFGTPHFTIKFDPNPQPWLEFRAELMDRVHQLENAKTP